MTGSQFTGLESVFYLLLETSAWCSVSTLKYLYTQKTCGGVLIDARPGWVQALGVANS